MDIVSNFLSHPVHVILALAVVLVLARAGRAAARWLRQPEVVGEVTVGLLIGPLVLALSDRASFDALLPGAVLGVLKFVGQTGLVLYLVGLAHKLRPGPGGPSQRTLSGLVGGAFVLPLATGLLLVGLIRLTDDTAARGDAPLPAFVLLVAVAMSITAVPVLSRILGDRGMSDTTEGRFALASAVVMDSLGWIMLTLAIGLGAGDLSGLWGSGLALLAGGGCALLLRLGLLTAPARRLCLRMPRTTAVLLGCAAMGTALLTERLGMTAIVGAAMVGLAIPGEALAPWTKPVAAVSHAGRTLTPVFFVVTGVTVLIDAFSAASWTLITATLVLGCLGKLLGGYLGARLAGMPPVSARRMGALMNTRGLTELIVLEAGHRAGILPSPLVLALVIMALTTTAMTGPLLGLVDRAERRRGGPPEAAGLPGPVAAKGTAP
ncbi:cation:proton antiporter [Streptomyces halstedii]|uniref:cation:proton antiporter n=1 Tax=Streptomyces TaxID=1883 RepID=UPI00068998BE|nr:MULTISPECIES: cation:proton antiporter [Streptomyces]MYR72865.1 sodium:proton exchanger [Streptomyces sp. SID4925]SBU95547.1 Kef-type K+ transport system, membrane component KefB [Streptomyces sp. OspMP-M45]